MLCREQTNSTRQRDGHFPRGNNLTGEELLNKTAINRECVPKILVFLMSSFLDTFFYRPKKRQVRASTMSIVTNVRSGITATLLALTFLLVGAWLPHMYSSIRAFFLESLPSVLSAAMAPKCLFVFSNIIVVFLVGESKLSRRRGKLLNTDDIAHGINKGIMLQERKDEEEEVVAVTMEALLPMTLTGEINQEQENNMVMVADEDKGSSVFNRGLQMLDQCVDEVDHIYLHEVCEVQREVEDDDGEVELVIREGLRGEDEQDECTGMQEFQEMDLPPADELNRRVEDFIARFNMERQLEAKMLVACY